MHVETTSWAPLIRWSERAGLAAAVAALVGFEIVRHPEYAVNLRALLGYAPEPETTWLGIVLFMKGWTEDELSYLLWLTWSGVALFAAIPLWRLGGPSRQSGEVAGAEPVPTGGILWILSACLFTLAVALLMLSGRQFLGMPPAYHDEYSYLFQAKTFLAGRLYFPATDLTQYFTQMHVLHDNGVFASRYFPGVGLWLAPWVAWGIPYAAPYLTGGIIVVLIAWIGAELPAANRRTTELDRPDGRHWNRRVLIGALAASLCALAPSMLLFGNLLLSHHPTTLGLLGFAYGYFRSVRGIGVGWPVASGVSLTFAMLCRPLTALGFALPFAVHLAFRLSCGCIERPRIRIPLALAPILVGIAILAGYNAALTGNPLETPYGLYTKIYTPSHRYGFHNVSREWAQSSDKVIENYDRWASELTPGNAFALTLRRAAASAQWTLGPITMAWVAAAVAVLFWRMPWQWRLIAASVAGVHAVYFPFAFEGIFGLSYVFETVPLLCLLAAGVVVTLWNHWTVENRWGRKAWFVLFLALNLNAPVLAFIRGASEIQFARRYYAGFEQRIRNAGVQPPAIILIRPDPADRHRDLITNDPALNGAILRARVSNVEIGGGSIGELLEHYPGRQVWIYDATTDQLGMLRHDVQPASTER